MTVTTNPTKICQPNSDNAHDYTYQAPVVQTGPERMQAEIDALRAELTDLIMTRMEINKRLAHLEAAVHFLFNSDEEPDAETVQP